jgi:hypothetical protein
MNSLQSFYETTGDTYWHLLAFLRSDSQCIEQIPDEILDLQDSEKETIENEVANWKDCESTVTTV